MAKSFKLFNRSGHLNYYLEALLIYFKSPRTTTKNFKVNHHLTFFYNLGLNFLIIKRRHSD